MTKAHPDEKANPMPALWFCIASLACGLFLSGQSWADPAGVELAQRVYDRPNGGDATSAVTMTLTEKGRSPRVRKMVVYRLDKKSGDISSLIRFAEPADIEGTGLLTIDRADGESSQWIYLPAMERVRRIDSNRKGGRFVNSDYYYEDLRDRKVTKDQHRIVGHENVSGVACDILESIPIEAGNSVYAKRLSWIDPTTLLPMRIDFFEKRSDQPSKRLLLLKQEKVQGYATVMDSTLTDLNSGHQTRLTLDRILYDRNLPEKLFTPQALEDESAEESLQP